MGSFRVTQCRFQAKTGVLRLIVDEIIVEDLWPIEKTPKGHQNRYDDLIICSYVPLSKSHKNEQDRTRLANPTNGQKCRPLRMWSQPSKITLSATLAKESSTSWDVWQAKPGIPLSIVVPEESNHLRFSLNLSGRKTTTFKNML